MSLLGDRHNKPYSWDEPLFNELGLEFFDIGVWQKHYIGKVDIGDSWVKVWVKACPAQFWTFEIYCGKSKKHYEVRTGSGRFVDYWPFAKSLAESIVTIKEIKT